MYDQPVLAPLKDNKIMIYGWLDIGGTLSTSKHSMAPNSYAEVPNAVQLDQFVVRVERQVDTSQTNHADWGFRISALYGEDYRFTTAQGFFSGQLLQHNSLYGFDIPELYAEFYLPYVAEGMDIQIGRSISPPDIEAQLSPQNYLYSHSTMFTFDAYTQTGILTVTRLNRNWQLEVGVNGTNDVMLWDPATTLNVILMVRWDADDGKDSVYTGIVPMGIGHNADTFNHGHDNFNGYWFTYSHKFNDVVSTDTEMYYMWQRNGYVGGTPIQGNPQPYYSNVGLGAYLPGLSTNFGAVNYTNFKLSDKDYISIRNEVFTDPRGERTGYRNTYTSHTIGWCHNLSELVTFRPEIKYEHAYENPAYDNGMKSSQTSLMADIIVRF